MAKKSKKSGSAGQRPKKKHAKELKRKNKLANPDAPRGVPARSSWRREKSWQPEKEGIEGLAFRLRDQYYPLARELGEYTALPLDDLPSMVWTPARIAALSTGELLDRLGGVGIATTEGAFVGATAPDFSAVRFARRAWLPLLPASATVHDRDLALLGACSLWQRLRPATPSLEGIVDPFLDGMDHADKGRDEAALEAWMVFFDRLRPWLTPAIRTLDAVETLMDGMIEDMEAWTVDLFELTFELAPRPPDLIRRVVAVLHALAEQLTEERPIWRRMVLDDQARLLAAIGAEAEAEQMLRAEIAKDPADLHALFTLADYLLDTADDEAEGFDAAIAALEDASTTGMKPRDRSELNERIAELHEWRADARELDDSP